MRIKLTVAEIQNLSAAIVKNSGRNGFQDLLLDCWCQLNNETGEFTLDEALLDRIHQYAFSLGNSNFRETLRQIFRRTLGANLDRGRKRAPTPRASARTRFWNSGSSARNRVETLPVFAAASKGRTFKFLIGGLLGGAALAAIFSATVDDWSYFDRWLAVPIFVLALGGYFGFAWLIGRVAFHLDHSPGMGRNLPEPEKRSSPPRRTPLSPSPNAADGGR